MRATAKELVGRKIIAVNFRRFSDGKRGWAFRPLITLDNGRRIWFTAQETELGEYGVKIGISDVKDG